MDYKLSNKSFQFMLLQNKAYHEEKLIHLKPRLNTTLTDFSHILDPKQPSKKNYLIREKEREIQLQNMQLFNKIHTIICEKGHHTSNKLPKVVERSNAQTSSYSFSNLDSSNLRSMNFSSRKKEFDRINDDNRMLLTKIKTAKPTISFDELKQHAKQIKKISKRLRTFDKYNQPKSVLCIYDRNKLNPILNKFINRHDQLDTKYNNNSFDLSGYADMGSNGDGISRHSVSSNNSSRRCKDIKRSNSQNNLESIVEDHLNEMNMKTYREMKSNDKNDNDNDNKVSKENELRYNHHIEATLNSKSNPNDKKHQQQWHYPILENTHQEHHQHQPKDQDQVQAQAQDEKHHQQINDTKDENPEQMITKKSIKSQQQQQEQEHEEQEEAIVVVAAIETQDHRLHDENIIINETKTNFTKKKFNGKKLKLSNLKNHNEKKIIKRSHTPLMNNKVYIPESKSYKIRIEGHNKNSSFSHGASGNGNGSVGAGRGGTGSGIKDFKEKYEFMASRDVIDHENEQNFMEDTFEKENEIIETYYVMNTSSIC